MKRYVNITFNYADGRKGRCRVPIGIKDIVVASLYKECYVYNLKVDDLPYEEHFKLYGGNRKIFEAIKERML